jgi:CRISPR/Cas system-associated exonuclease Cas4 (RecB family)
MRRIWTIADLDELRDSEDPKDQEFLKQKFAEVTILPDIEDYLRYIHDNSVPLKVRSCMNRKKKRALGVHPSAASKRDLCPLKIYWDCTQEVEPHRPYNQQNQEIWDLGTMLHDRLQTILELIYGDQFTREVPLSIPELLIVGHTDGVLEFEVSGIRIVLEIKSIKEGGQYGWEKVQLKPMADNVRQCTMYMKAKNIPFGIIFYINKNSGLFKEHPIMFDHEIWDDIEKNVLPVVQAVQSKALVKAKPSWWCKSCDYVKACNPGRREGHGKGSSSWKKTRTGH